MGYPCFNYSEKSCDATCTGNTDKEHEELDWQEDGVSEKNSNKRGKAGRTSQWSQEMLTDFIDIIVGNEYYKTKLILGT